MKSLKKLFETRIILFFLCALFFSNKMHAQIGWEELKGINIPEQYSKTPRERASNAFTFGINNQIYFGLGEIVYNLYPTNFPSEIFAFNLDSLKWNQINDAPFSGRSNSTFFSINGNRFMVGGKEYNNNLFYYDNWQFDSSTTSWTQRASFPGASTWNSSGFSLNGLGYVVCGADSQNIELNEVWQYDPTLDSWTRKSDFPGTSRENTLTFTLNNKGYLLGGYNISTGILSDFWQYDDANDSWIQLPNPGLVGDFAKATTLNDSAYVILNNNEMYCYNYQNSTWTRKIDYPFLNNVSSLTSNQNNIFAIDGKQVLQYDPSQDLWNEIHPASIYNNYGMKNVIFNGSVYSNNLRYDSSSDYWIFDTTFVQCSNMHNLNGNVYAVRGFNSTFQMFDSVSQSWLNRAALSPSLIPNVSFQLGTDIYIGAGDTSGLFYKYDSQLDSMIQRANFPGPYRSNSGSFVLNNKFYLVSGFDDDSYTYYNDLWEYDPLTDVWLQKANYPGSNFLYAIYCYSNYRGYAGLGKDIPGGYELGNEIFEYNPDSDSWNLITYFPGGGRSNATMFVLDNYIYISGGSYSLLQADQISTPDVWKYLPAASLQLAFPTQTICSNESSFSLTGGGPNGGNYAGAGVVNNSFNPSIAGAGQHLISYSISFGDTTYSLTDTLTVLMSPNIQLGSDTIICYSGSLLLDPGSGYSSYLWNTGETTSTITVDSITIANNNQTFWVIVNDSNGCNASDTIGVTLDICNGISVFNDPDIFEIYPNPSTTSSFTIDIPGEAQIEIFNSQMKLLMTQKLIAGTNTINTTFPSGMYQIKILFNNKIYLRKYLVIENK